MKFAATILALALATTHGLLDEGDHNVQKKDASKGLRGSAVDSSLERAAVGRKLDFYHPVTPPTAGPQAILITCCDGSLGSRERCDEIAESGECTCCDGSLRTPEKSCEELDPILCPPTPKPTPRPTPSPTCPPKKLDVCIIVDESGSICSFDPLGNPKVCEDGECTATTCTDTVPPSDVCNYAEDCPKFNGDIKTFATALITELEGKLVGDNDELQVSVVEFATNIGEEIIPLTTPELAKAAVNDLVYSGGFTNVEEAIDACRVQLSSPDTLEVIVLISDGDATTFGEGIETCPSNSEGTECKVKALDEATAAKTVDGITIATAFVFDTEFPTPAGSAFLEAVASDPVLAVEDRVTPDAEELATNILNFVSPCSSN